MKEVPVSYVIGKKEASFILILPSFAAYFVLVRPEDGPITLLW
jgi:hypothetical protein